MYGTSTPELREVGMPLPVMEASSCAVERSFSLQKSIHSHIRNPLKHAKVAKLIFSHSTMNLFVCYILESKHFELLKSVLGSHTMGDTKIESENDADGG